VSRSASTIRCCHTLWCRTSTGRTSSRGSLHRTLEWAYRLTLLDGEEEIEASLATAYEAGLLQVQPGAPVLVVHRTTYLAGYRPVERTRAVLASGRYRYVINVAESSIHLTTLEGSGWTG
jgi:DNA-binding GntR family transcriptional regulator